MESTSIKRLADIVEASERLIARVTSLDTSVNKVRIPAAPVPLTLEGLEEWLKNAEEYCRRPRIAESKRLLKEKGIEAASIVASVLEAPEEIERLIDTIESLPLEFRSSSYQALGAALTKGMDDAETAVAPFLAAAGLVDDWSETDPVLLKMRQQALEEIALEPQRAARILAVAKEVCEILSDFTAKAITIPDFSSVQTAHDELFRFNKALFEYDSMCSAEGVDIDVSLPQGMTLDGATYHFERKRSELLLAKSDLQTEVASLMAQLAAIGGVADISSSTIHELRCAVESLSHEITRRREELQQSLGNDVYLVVEAVSRGTLPDRGILGDQELGSALRQAVDCGYQMTLENPSED